MKPEVSKAVSVEKIRSISRILWLEDSEDDAFLAERELKKAGFVFTGMRVDTREDFIKALDTFDPEIILSDHSLPQFNSVQAYEIYKEKAIKVPFILVTGTVSEEFAVGCLKLGIDDYIVKSNLAMLPAAVLGALNAREAEKTRKEREEEIKRQNEKLEEEVTGITQEVINEKSFSESIVNSMPGVFYVVESDRIIKWNKNLENVSGYSSKELEGLNFVDLFSDPLAVGKQFQRILRLGISMFETVIKTKTGNLIPYYFTGVLNPIGSKKLVVCTGVDIAELKNTQEILRLKDERLELAFSSTGNAWWDWDIATGKMDSHPNRFLSLGYAESDVEPTVKWWQSLVHAEDTPSAKQEMKNCLSGLTSMFDTQYRMTTKSGELKWVRAIGKIVTRGDGGEPLRMIGMSNDISKIKLIEKELTEAKSSAESANETKSQFLANMSHEIRTPMNAIIGLSHLTLKTELTEKQLDYLKKIRSSSESLLGIINDILDFSKIEAGKLSLEAVPFDLEEVFQRLADIITYKAYSKGLEIAFGIDRDVFSHLVGDPVRLEQILTNLCSNAVKFTDRGEVVVKAKLLEETATEVKLQFKVSDTGIGMSAKQLEKLFEPFTQADDSISRKYGGTGLGLSIIKRLVELMNGAVWVKSKPGIGSHFYFTTIFKKQDLEIPKPIVDPRNLKVLIVDDNKSARKILKEALESLSFEVIALDSGIQAIHYLKNNNEDKSIQLVLMDWKMPEMDGLEAAEIIREDSAMAGIKIIVMCTSYANEEIYEQSEKLGLSGVLIKPIRYSTLYDTIISAVENGGRHKQTNGRRKEVQETAVKEAGTLLLVEDNDINQQVASELLERFGFTVEIASNGKDAIQIVKGSGVPSRFDLVLMDLQMPVMSGYTATTEIRKLKDYASLPIIAMTADAMGGVKEKCLEVGMMDFLTKPINPERMLEVVKKWIKRDKSREVKAEQLKNNETLPEMEGVDVADGLGHLGGNIKLYQELLAKFRDNNGSFLENLEKEFGAGKHEDVQRMLHTMKGMSGNLGMPKLHVACRTAEEKLSEKKADIRAIIKIISPSLKTVLNSLKDKLPVEQGVRVTLPAEAQKETLDKLARLVRDQDPEVSHLLKEIETIKGYEKEFERLRLAVSKYDFDKAAVILKEINP